MNFTESLGPGFVVTLAVVAFGFLWRAGGLLAEYLYWSNRRD